MEFIVCFLYSPTNFECLNDSYEALFESPAIGIYICSLLKFIFSVLQYIVTSAIFLKKEGSGTHRVTQNSVGDGVNYTNPKKRRFQNAIQGCILLRRNFWNSISTCSVKKIP
jgi:hypothetical protein